MTSSNSEINKDWKNAFPELQSFAPCRFYQVIGPVIFGIKLSKISSLNIYRPSLEVIGLWELENDNFRAFFQKGFMFEYFGYTIGFMNIGVDVDRHNKDYFEITQLVRKEIGIELGKSISIEEFISCLDFWKERSLENKSTGFQINYFVLKITCAIYVDRNDLVLNFLNEIEIASKNWDLKQIEYLYGSIEEWCNTLLSVKREDLHNRIQKNITTTKLKKLPNYELLHR